MCIHGGLWQPSEPTRVKSGCLRATTCIDLVCGLLEMTCVISLCPSRFTYVCLCRCKLTEIYHFYYTCMYTYTHTYIHSLSQSVPLVLHIAIHSCTHSAIHSSVYVFLYRYRLCHTNEVMRSVFISGGELSLRPRPNCGRRWTDLREGIGFWGQRLSFEKPHRCRGRPLGWGRLARRRRIQAARRQGGRTQTLCKNCLQLSVCQGCR